MKDIILKKISNVLKSEIDTEAKTLYLLAEIRKILELDKKKILELDKKKITLIIYCDWALHTVLNFKDTIARFSNKLENNIDYKIDIKEIAGNLKSSQSNFFKLNELKKELREFLKKNNLPCELVNNSNRWFKFIELLLEILKECTVIFKEGEIDKLTIGRDEKGNNYYGVKLRNSRDVIKIKLKIKRSRV